MNLLRWMHRRQNRILTEGRHYGDLKIIHAGKPVIVGMSRSRLKRLRTRRRAREMSNG